MASHAAQAAGTVSGAELRSLLDRYYETLPAGSWQSLPLADGAVFTENGQQLAFGTGLWATATGAADSRTIAAVADEATGTVAGWGMVREGGQEGDDALLGVRLATSGKAVIEAETLVVRRKPFGRDTFPDSLLKFSEPMAEVLDAADKPGRQDLVKAANGYLDGVARDDADLIPAADGCLRIENGLQTVLNPDGAGFPYGMRSGW